MVLRPVVKPVAQGCEGGEGRGDGGKGERNGEEGVYSVWRWREVRFAGFIGGNGLRICRGDDLAWWLRGSSKGRGDEKRVDGYRDEVEKILVLDEKEIGEGKDESIKKEAGKRLGKNWMRGRGKWGRGRGGGKRKSVTLGGEKGLEILWEEDRSL